MQPYFAEQCSTSEKTSQWAEKDRLHCIEEHSVTTPYWEVAEHHFEMQNLCKGIYSYCLAHFKSAGSWYTNVQSVNYEQRLRFEVFMFLEWTAIHFSLKSGMASPARAAVLNATLSFGESREARALLRNTWCQRFLTFAFFLSMRQRVPEKLTYFQSPYVYTMYHKDLSNRH